MSTVQEAAPQTRYRRGAQRRRRFDYVAVGHVTADVIRGRRRGGGGALYSAVQAARLGLSTLIVTRGVAAEIDELVAPFGAELQLHVTHAPATTTLETRGAGARRSQRVLAWAGPIERIPPVRAGILHLAPVARETTAGLAAAALGAAPGFLGLTPQGLVRRWDGSGGRIEPVELDERSLPTRYDAAVISERERSNCRALFASLARTGAVIAVTSGSEATRVHTATAELSVAPPVVGEPVDDLGAGDVFAAAFFVALHRGRAPAGAAAFGNAAAAVKVAAAGPGAVGDEATIERLAAASAR